MVLVPAEHVTGVMGLAPIVHVHRDLDRGRHPGLPGRDPVREPRPLGRQRRPRRRRPVRAVQLAMHSLEPLHLSLECDRVCQPVRRAAAIADSVQGGGAAEGCWGPVRLGRRQPAKGHRAGIAGPERGKLPDRSDFDRTKSMHGRQMGPKT